MSFIQQRFLVTGASGGIGRATAVRLAKVGAGVLASGTNTDELAHTLSLMQKVSPDTAVEHHLVPYDLSNVDGIADWVKSLRVKHGELSGLAHCAGVQVTKTIRQFDSEFFDQIMHQNLASAFALCKGFRHKRDRNKTGSIVFVSSVGAFIGQPANTVYGASKAGLISASKGLAMELVRENIRVNCVAPALVNTAMAQHTEANMTQAQFANILANHPMGIGEPEDVAHAICFLLSAEAKWINGVCLPVDGGYLAQ